MKSNPQFKSVWVVAAMLLVAVGQLQAQWLTQTLDLKAGWNGVYLHVDASHATLDQLVGSNQGIPIEEIWLWAPDPVTAQYVTSPAKPVNEKPWLHWTQAGNPAATLTRLPGNAACLVRVSADYTWQLKGKVVAPSYRWTSSGQNLIGFPTVPDQASYFDSFLRPAPGFKSGLELYAYSGNSTEPSPTPVTDLASTRVKRGQAFWVRTKESTTPPYTGPFEVGIFGPEGVRFNDSIGQVRFRLRNTTHDSLEVTLTNLMSEPAPDGQSPVTGLVPILIRGELKDLAGTFDPMPPPQGVYRWTLARQGEVGSDIEVVIGVDRQQLTGHPGDLYGSILRFADSLGHIQVDVPVTATVAPTTGLWVGGAVVSSVDHSLRRYAKLPDIEALSDEASATKKLGTFLRGRGLAEGKDGYHYEVDRSTGRVLVFNGPDANTPKKGEYLLDADGVRTDAGTVARPFPLRLIMHDDGTATRLLQKVYLGLAHGQPVLATRESLLDPTQLASARRISAVHLPTSHDNDPWAMIGKMVPGESLAVTVHTRYDDQSSNPFLHTYHPDHDNLDAAFAQTLNRGAESYEVERRMTLHFAAPGTDFDSLTRGGARLMGDYQEEVTLAGRSDSARSYRVRGTFVLDRISDISTLTTSN